MSTSDANRGREPSDRAAKPGQREQARLDDAMQRADELLVTSLKADERRRGQRTLAKMLVGAIALVAVASAATAFFLADKERKDEPQQVAETVEKPEYLTANQVRAEMLVKEAQQQVKNGRQDSGERYAAVNTFRKATELDPNNIEAWFGLGQSCYRTGKLRAGENALKHVLKLEPQHLSAMMTLGQLYLFEQRYPEAEKLLLQVVAIEPRREGAAAYLLQDLYSQVGDTEKSKNWMSKIPLTPERADAQARFNEDRVSDGRKAVYEKRAQIEREKQQLPLPKTSDERTLQSWVQMKMNYPARDDFKKQAAEDPENAVAISGSAWQALWQAVERRPWRGDERNESGLDFAKRRFEQALAIDPKLPVAMHGLARVLQEQGDLEGAIAQWQALLVEHPDYQPALTKLTDVYLEQDQPDKALPYLERLAKLRPRDQTLGEKIDAAKAAVSQDAGNVPPRPAALSEAASD